MPLNEFVLYFMLLVSGTFWGIVLIYGWWDRRK